MGKDKYRLSRLVWTRHRGKKDTIIRIISAYDYRSRTGSSTVCDQQRRYVDSIGDNRPPRQDFMEDIFTELNDWIKAGEQIVLIVDDKEHVQLEGMSLASHDI